MNEFGHKFCTKALITALEMKIPDFFPGEKETIFAKILDGCILPDSDETMNGYSVHFFNPVTNENYLGGEDSAKSRCLTHFSKFVMTKDFTELGRACHFLEDICTPVHTQYEDKTDAVIRGALHLEFEKEFDRFLESYSPDLPEHIPNFSSISELINYCALESANNYYAYRDKKEDKQEIFKRTALLATMALFKLCEFFYKQNPRACYIKDGTIDAGIFLDCGNKEVSTMTESHRFRFNCDGDIFMFEKPGVGRNFTLKNIIKKEELHFGN